MGLKPLSILMVNVSYYNNCTLEMDTRSSIIYINDTQHTNIHKHLKRTFGHLVVGTLHGSERNILILDNEDFYCAVIQNYVKNGMNAPLDLYVNIRDLRSNGFLANS